MLTAWFFTGDGEYEWLCCGSPAHWYILAHTTFLCA